MLAARYRSVAAGAALLTAAALAVAVPGMMSAADASTASAEASGTLPFGSVAGGFAPLPGGQVARVSVGAGKTVTVTVAGHAGVPSGDTGAVALAVATTTTPAAGTITAFPAGGSRPSAPALTWTAGRAASGQASTELSAAGKVSFANSAKHAVTLTVDATGYWFAGAPAVAGAFGPLPGAKVARVSVGAGKTVTVTAAGHGGIPKGVGAVSLGIATTAVAAAGSLTVYPAGTARPGVPTLSWAAGQPAAGVASAQLPGTGKLAVTNTAKRAVTVTIDATGYWLGGTPAATGAFGPLPGAKVARVSVGAGKTVTVTAAGHGGIPASGAGAVALALATTATAAAGAITVYPSGGGRPSAPTLTWAARQAVAGQAIARMPSSGKVNVTNTAKHAVTLTISAVGYWLAKARTVAAITPKSTTATIKAAAITQVTGSPAGTQTVTLAADAAVPAVQRVIVAGTSAAAPDGLLGTVTAVASGANGTHILTITPATLSQAYSTFNVSTSQQLTSSEVTEPSGTASPSGAAGLPSGPRPEIASAAGTSGFGFNLSKTSFDCTGSGAGPTIALTADLSKIDVDLSLDTNPSAPSIHFLITADPVFDINVGFTGQVTCKLPLGTVMTAHIPVPGAPGLFVDLSPVVELTAGGQASLDFQWAPRAAIGFDKGPGISTESHGFGSSGSVAVSATAGADLFLGLDADLTLAGRIGVGGDFGPDLGATYDASSGCVTVDGELKADLTADANVFVKDWTFALASGIFLEQRLYQKCPGGSSGPPVIATTTLPGATVGAPYSARLATADDRAGTWKIASGKLPAGLSLSGAVISGKPTTAGTDKFTVSFTDASQRTATASVTIAVAAAGAVASSWTAARAPLPANAAASAVVEVRGVSCASATSCVAVGDYKDTAGATEGLLLTRSGSSWTAAQAPLPANAAASPEATLAGVSCPSATFCVAVGSYVDTAGAPDDEVLSWSGGSWTAKQAPLPANALGVATSGIAVGGGLNAVSCPSTTFCVAAGGYIDTANALDGVLLTWSSGSWKAVEAPRPAGSASGNPETVLGVSCPSASFCVAGGQDEETSGAFEGLLLTWSGGSWTAAQAPVPANYDGILGVNAVSCPSASSCAAGGYYEETSGVNDGVLLSWSGGSWSAVAAPLPAGAADGPWADVSGVSCPSASTCVADGYYDVNTETSEGLLLTRAGGSWTAKQAPLPAGAAPVSADSADNNNAWAVSCPSATSCTAVGYYQDASSSQVGLLLTS